jgi:hypothetical protein
MKGKKGLSDIVVTLIIVLLSLVAVGIVWLVISRIVQSGASGLDINAKCLSVAVDVESAVCVPGATNHACNVTFSRAGTGGTDEIGGVKLVFRDTGTGISSLQPINSDGDIAPLVGKKVTDVDTGIPIANAVTKIDVTVFFKDSSNREQLCSQTNSFEF